MQRQKASPYASLIAAATDAPESKLTLLENLMRDEIFHSTLDWQSAEELAEGARRAHDLYRSAPSTSACQESPPLEPGEPMISIAPPPPITTDS